MQTTNLNVTQRLLTLYRKYAQEQTDPYLCASIERCIEQIEKNPILLNKLNIELSIKEIEDIFDKHKIIQLRAVGTHTALLLGCGNHPAEEYFSVDHEHEGYDTINPEITMNPTIVGAFGINKGIIDILPSHHYDNLAIEAVTIGEFATDFDGEYLLCMKPQFKVYEISEDKYYNLETSPLFFHKDRESFLCEELNEKLRPEEIKLEENGTVSFIYQNEKKCKDFFEYHGWGEVVFEEGLWKLQANKEQFLDIVKNAILVMDPEKSEDIVEKLFENSTKTKLKI